MPSFDQDRLGTNIGKGGEKEGLRFAFCAALIEFEEGVDICAHFVTMEEAKQIATALVAALLAVASPTAAGREATHSSKL